MLYCHVLIYCYTKHYRYGFKLQKTYPKDYSLSLKLQIVQEIEQGLLSPSEATFKYGIQARSTIRTWLKNMVTLIINIQFKRDVKNSRATYFRIRATS